MHHLANAPAIGILKLPRDIIMMLVFGFFGFMGLLVTNSLMGYNVFTEKTKIGYVEYLGQSESDPSHIRMRFQKTDADGNPIGSPIDVESPGDSIVLWYTIVTVKPTFLQLGKKQVYKIDYISGDFWQPIRNETLNYAVIEGGRQERFKEIRDTNNRPFPYNLWVDSVQFAKQEYIIEDLKKGVRCDVLLVHNAIHIDNPKLFEFNENELFISEIGMKVRNIESTGEEYGIEVIEIVEGSKCADAGILVGDVLLRMNDNRIENVRNMRFNFFGISKGGSEIIKFGIKRNDEELNMDVKFANSSRITVESDLNMND
ncbi:MAG: PDZ domain-containing protein [Planctomycetes bacterium]|nr:PDZ domain-containing protein [Planctomycetota bacterium]